MDPGWRQSCHTSWDWWLHRKSVPCQARGRVVAEQFCDTQDRPSSMSPPGRLFANGELEARPDGSLCVSRERLHMPYGLVVFTACFTVVLRLGEDGFR